MDKNFLSSQLKMIWGTYDDIQKIATGQGHDYTTGCLLNYFYFKEHYKMMLIDLSKQETLDADPKVIKQNNFTVNLAQDGNTTMLLIIEEVKETTLDFLKGTMRLF